MNLVIDIGNTRSKLAIFKNNKLIKIFHPDIFTVSFLEKIKTDYPDIRNVLVSAVGEFSSDIKQFFEKNYLNFHQLTSNTSLPISNLYETKEQLGKDRIASVVGAHDIYPTQNILIIDLGTAITIDFINKKGQYLGGNISPGMNMRFKALNLLTNNLPQLKSDENFSLIAKNTNQAIISGVQNGIIFEIDAYIDKIKSIYPDLIVIFTGGDAIFFDKKLKNTIFVNSNLNFIGLNRILTHNDKKN